MNCFVLLKTLYELATPPASLAVAIVLSLVLVLFGWWRTARWLVALAIGQFAIMAFPPVGNAMLSYLEDQARAAERAAPRCCFDAIVVLGGGISAAMPAERGFPRRFTGADRVWLAARLYRKQLAPLVIVSGGSLMADPEVRITTEAAVMRQLLMDLGVPDEAIAEEGKSTNTIERIRNVRAAVGTGRVALITSAYRMPRTMQLAALAKLDAVPFSADFRTLGQMRPTWDDWIFSSQGLELSNIALWEIIAIATQRLGD